MVRIPTPTAYHHVPTSRSHTTRPSRRRRPSPIPTASGSSSLLGTHAQVNLTVLITVIARLDVDAATVGLVDRVEAAGLAEDVVHVELVEAVVHVAVAVPAFQAVLGVVDAVGVVALVEALLAALVVH